MKDRMSRRTFLTMLSATAASSVLAACGAGSSAPAPVQSGTSPTESSAAPAAAPEATAAAPPAAASGATTLTFWNESRGVDLETFCIGAQNFQKSAAGANITVNCTGFDDLTKVVAATAAGNPPDLVQTYEWPKLPTLFQQGAVVPLTSYMEKDKFDTSIVLPGVLDACRATDGTFFALPYMCYATTDFFWNKKLFTEKGLDPEKPPQTLEELQQMAEKFDVMQDGKLVQVGFHPRAGASPEAYCYAFGGTFYDPVKQQITPLDPGVIKGLEFMISYAEKYGADNLDRLSAAYGQYQSANNPFLAGQVAMTGFWDALPAYRDRYAPDVEMGFSSFPYPATMPDQKGWGKLDFNLCFIPKSAKNPDQAWELLKFIQQDIPTNIDVATKLANTPQNVNAISDPANTADPMLKEIQQYAAGSKMEFFPPIIPVAAQYKDEWRRQVDLMYHGKISIQDGSQKVMDIIQPELEKALKG